MTILNHLQQYPPLLSVGEVASLLCCKEKTIYLWIKEGKVPGVIRIGKSIRVNGDVLLQYIKDQSKKGSGNL